MEVIPEVERKWRLGEVLFGMYTPVHPGKSFMRRIRSLEVGFSRLCRLVIRNRGNVVGRDMQRGFRGRGMLDGKHHRKQETGGGGFTASH